MRNQSGFPTYVVITPVRDEAAYISKTLESMIHQTVRPLAWVIVNDGSTDLTESIVRQSSQDHPWIKLVNLPDRGVRQRGKGVVEAFYAGYRTLTEDFDYIVKLDGDVSFEPTYFEILLNEFVADPQMGITGGGVYESQDGKNWILCAFKDHVRGPTKVYRRTCFDAIGGLVPAMGWDGIDEWKALSLGWKVQSFLEVKIVHYRYTGAATGALKSFMEQGLGAYRMGYHPMYMIARCIQNLAKRPYLMGGIAMMAGYLGAFLRREDMLAESSVVNFVRRTQRQKLIGLLHGRPVHE